MIIVLYQQNKTNRLEIMNYKELQSAIKQFKVKNLTDVKLNASQKVLQSEYDRLTIKETTPPVLEIAENIETNLETYEKTRFESGMDHFIERIEKTLVVKFNCDYKVTRSMVLENKDLTVKEAMFQIAKKADVNKIDFLLALEQNIEDIGFDLTAYRYDSLSYFVENLKTEAHSKEVLEIVPSENDPSFNTAIQYFVNAVNHVFKRFGSDNFTTEQSLRLSMANNVSINDLIKFLNLNTGFDLTEFIEYLEYHLEDQYQYFIQYSFLNYRKYSIKMILQDFADVIDIHQLVA